MCMAARILAIRPMAASLSLALSREVLLRGVKTGETLRVDAGPDVVLEPDVGAATLESKVLLPEAADADADADALTLRRASSAILYAQSLYLASLRWGQAFARQGEKSGGSADAPMQASN
ncbi:glutamyl-tRNA synthetase [Pseudozyma hubeiensis SY62]|uniref:Glutamyl-tRNA synthetase n=1 Tax=Pseudozyma hubeiensis (strain SY62) TaxID=1305764 RepID=R9PB47_PSEHS|nr:glutamyl-tRNA synthetase [Pseudozyma hubeiensis SY62]GAC98452.1 glutamyl-tRNA synthetase [Pseudozyma hubeiensis SY62]